MAESQAVSASPAKAEPNHGLRIFLTWIVLALVADLLIWFVWYPHMPPGDMTSSAQHQQFDIAVLGFNFLGDALRDELDPRTRLELGL